MENLPIDLAFNILLRLSIRSLIQIKCVSKTWRDIIQHPRLVSLCCARWKDHPCLLFHSNDQGQTNQLCIVGKDLSSVVTATGLDDKINSLVANLNFVGSCNGLICVSGGSYLDPAYILNVVTGEFMELPCRKAHVHKQIGIGFGFHPESREYKIVRLLLHTRIYKPAKFHAEIEVLTLGTNEWRNIGQAPGYRLQGPCDASVNGSLYWVVEGYWSPLGPAQTIVSFNLRDEEFSEIPIPDRENINKLNLHLSNIDDHLCLSMYCEDGSIEVWMMKDNNAGGSIAWNKDFIINNNYLSCALNQNNAPSPEDTDVPIRKPFKRTGEMRVVGELRKGEILLEHEAGVLITYNADSEDFVQLIDGHGLSERLSATMMSPNASLSSISTILGITTPLDMLKNHEVHHNPHIALPVISRALICRSNTPIFTSMALLEFTYDAPLNFFVDMTRSVSIAICQIQAAIETMR